MSPQLVVDRDRCIGAGMCALIASRIFDQDEDDGQVLLLDPNPRPDDPELREAVAACPSGAIAFTLRR